MTFTNSAKSLVALLLLLLIFIVPLYIKALLNAQTELSRARALANSKDYENSVDAYRKALSWSAPFNRYSRLAKSELYDLATNKTKRDTFRLEALRQFKRGIMSSRNFLSWDPEGADRSWLELIEAELNSLAPLSSSTISNANPPKVSFSNQILAQIMFWLWVLSALGACFLGFSKEGKIKHLPFFTLFLLSVASYLIWLKALSMA